VKPGAVFFDLDDTLVVEEASAEAAFLDTCRLAEARYGIEVMALFATIRETCRRLWHEGPAYEYCRRIGVSSWEGMWARFQGNEPDLAILREWAPFYHQQSWREAIGRYGVDDPVFALELDEAFQSNRRHLHVVYDDVVPVLETLKDKYPMAIVTNGLSDLQREKIDGARIGGYFHSIVISGDLGFGKPNPQIYQWAMAGLRISSGRAVMVGNSLNSDVRGAQHAGIRAVWLNRTGQSNQSSTVPDFEVASLIALPGLLDALE
jgi:putative hydrolase of the HAD superfamily